ncbi:MAG TPA: hypothetical protein GX706_00405, partial [Candidatus Moranbacteria bacterium]|nr:hypothetical protein [Candidatus Moranbacteria bacterium]
GFGIFLLSWLIVYTVLRFVSFNFGAVNSGSWWKIECDTRSYFSGNLIDPREDIPNKDDGTGEDSSPGTGKTTEPTRSLGPIDSAKEKEVRDLLAAEGIGINNPPCTTTRRSNCTNVAGMKQETIQGIIDLKRKCNCEVIVTGGTEPGHSSAHTNGSKADFRSHYFGGKPSELTNYIVRDKKFGEKIGVRPGNYGGDIYRDGDNYYVKEGDHWDVCFNCTCATTASGSCQYPKPK